MRKDYSPAKRQPKPVAFVCIVKEERLEATITHEDECVPGRLFRLSFSDGHKGVFLAVPDSGNWREEGMDGSAYAAAVSTDLHTLRTFDPKDPPFAVAATEEGAHFNVWVNPENGGYGVYYGGLFRFHLRYTNRTWSVRPGKNYDRDANREIVEAVTYRLITTL